MDKAGRILASSEVDSADVVAALEVFANWRAAHGYPLNTAQIVLRHRVKRAGLVGLVSQRHKRELSIVRKLERSRTMRLSQMQDIAGCRAVLSSMAEVDYLLPFYQDSIRDDYIRIPPASGYRSIHAVAAYQGKSKTDFDGLYVETQIRTGLQHAWATAVETVDTFTGSDLKSGYGDAAWRRLFALIGTAFAMQEQTAAVPGTPLKSASVSREIGELEGQLGLAERLRTWHRTSQVVRSPEFRFKKYLLIEQWPSSGEIKLHTYGADQFEMASRMYSEFEQKVTKENRLQVVMASADSLRALKHAYPNLFVDPTIFLASYEKLLESQ